MSHWPIAVALVALALGCDPKDEAPPPAPIIRPVRYIVAHKDDAAQSRKFSGIAQASDQSRLSFRVSGPLKRIEVKVGDKVKKGQLIAEIEATDLQLKVSEAAANRAQAQAMERSARANYQRVRKLYEARGASRAELDSARANAESAAMSLSAAGQGVALLKRQVDYAKLTAPADGTISNISGEPGENVQAGAPIATLQSGEDVEVQVAVPASTITRIARDAPATVSFSSIAGETFAGTVSEVGVSSGQGTTYPVVIRFARSDPRIRPGMAAEVEFTFAADPESQYHRVPSSAVGESREGRFVYKVTKGEGGLGTVRRAEVTVGELTSAGLQILAGVEDGDLIVTAGVSRIRDGLEVKVPDAPAEPGE